MTEPAFPPRLSCDCHVHAIGPKRSFPLAPQRSYTPMDATVDDLAAMLRRTGAERAVIVQPSIYGHDNSCLVHALAVLGDAGRGVAVARDDCPASELDDLHKAGVRGLRVNLISSGRADVAQAREGLLAAVRKCERNGWHVQLFAEPSLVVALAAEIARVGATFVLDHFAMVKAGDGVVPPEIRRLQEDGHVLVKLSAPYRIATRIDDPAVARLARAFAAVPDSVLWASDWPHTPPHNSVGSSPSEETPYRDIATKALLDAVAEWFPDPAMQRRILVENPARLYDWPAASAAL
ncbi:MAG: amidohydrolase family protein [Rhizobiaceae bacterium]|nr:amidohydrolase family protein [Rhizobiaceae bacterium]